MAYFRGKSYVDGDLIVEGNLQVKKFTFADGDDIFFYPAQGVESLKRHHLVKFSSNDGALDFVPITVLGSSDSSNVAIEIKNSKFTISDFVDSSSNTSEVIISKTFVNNTPVLKIGSNTLTIDKVKVIDPGLRLIEDPTGDYWVYDV